MLSIVAKAAGVPFFVAAPSTSIDVAIAKGSDIEIEERTSKELTHAAGGKGERVVVEGIDVWNPAFDVAEAAFITGMLSLFPLCVLVLLHLCGVSALTTRTHRATCPSV